MTRGDAGRGRSAPVRPGCGRARSVALDRGAVGHPPGRGRSTGRPVLAAPADDRDGPHRRDALQHGWNTFSRLRDTLEADPRCTVLTERARLGDRARCRRRGARPARHRLTARSERLTPSGPTRWCWPPVRTTAPCPFLVGICPACITAGAAQALAKGRRDRVGLASRRGRRRPVPAPGRGVADGSRRRGARDASRPAGPTAGAGWLPRPWQLLGTAAKAGELAGYVGASTASAHPVPSRARRRRRPRRRAGRLGHRRPARRAPGHRSPARERRSPSTRSASATASRRGWNCAIAAGCRHRRDGFVDASTTTNAPPWPGVYAAGEITGIGGADPALAEGAVAGHCRGRRITGRPDDPRTRCGARARSAAVRRAGWLRPTVSGPAGGDWLTDDTLVCRCEEVAVRAQLAGRRGTPDAGAPLAQADHPGRAGPCQGRICGRTRRRPARRRDGSTDRRPIAIPIRLGELAPSTTRDRHRRIDQQPHLDSHHPPAEGQIDHERTVRPRRRHRRHHPGLQGGRLRAGRSRRRLRQVRRALRLPDRQRLPRCRPERLARRVLSR